MLRPLEGIYLVAGLAIIGHGVLTQTLSWTSLGAGMFFIGMVPTSRADRAGMDSPASFARRLLIAWLSEGKGKK